METKIQCEDARYAGIRVIGSPAEEESLKEDDKAVNHTLQLSGN